MTRVSRTNLGAWLIKWNPAVWDVAGWVEDGGTSITSCAVALNYRSRMMAPGDPLWFWISGSDRRLVRGLWGVGTVTGEVESHREPGVAPTGDRWLDETARRAVRYRIEIDVRLRRKGLSDGDLRAVGIDDLEVQRMPAGSNPSWVSTEQVARIADRCGDGWVQV